jgi:2-polyprenyl-3-methyl-5-hydroxy-6-metoxy-1,4-benzoquinol methylase
MKTYTTRPDQERTVAIACNLCRQDRATAFLEDDSYTFVRCQNCGLVYQNPQPVFADLRKRYSQGYFQYEIDNEANFFHLMRLGMGDIGFENLAAESPARNHTFLDIGCATGMLLESMRESGWTVGGVDLTPESAAYGREHRALDIYAGTLEEAALPAESQSVVHFSHVIEHVPDPSAFLREVARVMEPGGLVLVTTPNVRGLQARMFGNRWRSAIADHVYLFNKRTLRRSLDEAGLAPQRLVTWGGLAVGSAPTWIKRPFDKLAKSFGFGDVMMVAAAKSS